ncbi:MAG: RDD family protein [Rhodospirillaceae bacterium]|nr:RDD family protein [Rhodospirillaceae bacterium]
MMEYPKLWERLAAALIDWLIYTVVTFAVLMIASTFSFQSSAMLRIAGFVGMLLSVAIIIGYKVLFEGGRLQATPGKLAFGLQVVDAEGRRPSWMRALLRTWPWWIYLVTAITQLLLVGYWINAIVWLALLALLFTMKLPPGARCLHDTTSGLFVVKTSHGLVGRGG